MSADKIKVLIVEDSAVASTLLMRILRADPAIEISGWARSGTEALRLVAEKNPDVVTMDIQMPGIDGFECARRIMETHPVPIVIVSAFFSKGDMEQTFRSLEAGAVAAVEKPRGVGHPEHELHARKLVSTVKAMSEVRVVKRWARKTPPRPAPELRKLPALESPDIQLVAMGASTGGPPVLHAILAALPKPFPVPILIVQHISEGFLQGLVDWLTRISGIPVKIAAHGERALAGHAYLAPDGFQMRVEKGGWISCLPDSLEHGLRPSVSCLFRSVAECFGAHAVGVLLTGMGRDGAAELLLMRNRGAITIAQDKSSSVVDGMPGEAVKLGGATHVLPPDQIASLLEALVASPRRPTSFNP